MQQQEDGAQGESAALLSFKVNTRHASSAALLLFIVFEQLHQRIAAEQYRATAHLCSYVPLQSTASEAAAQCTCMNASVRRHTRVQQQQKHKAAA